MSRLDSLLNLGGNSPQPRPFVGFSIRHKVIEHDLFCEAIRQIALVHKRGVCTGVGEGLLVVANTGSGKSTALEYYLAQFPRSVSEGVTRIPVVLVITPEAPTVKNLAETILRAMGDPAAEKGSAEAKTDRIRYLIEKCGVELFLIDEFQHFNARRRSAESERVTDWLKNLFNATKTSVVLAGLHAAIEVVNSNRQLRRRFASPFCMKSFEYQTEPQQRVFRAVLKQIHAMLPVACVPLHDANLARRFYFATNGLMDYVVKIIDSAVSEAHAPDHSLSQESFAAAFQQTVWRDMPVELNPFDERCALRPLTNRGEPFDICDDPSRYLSPRTKAPRVAKRGGK
jgi:Bacterial TniB protein